MARTLFVLFTILIAAGSRIPAQQFPPGFVDPVPQRSNQIDALLGREQLDLAGQPARTGKVVGMGYRDQRRAAAHPGRPHQLCALRVLAPRRAAARQQQRRRQRPIMGRGQRRGPGHPPGAY